MGQWVPVAGLVIAAVAVLAWWRITASAGAAPSSPLRRLLGRRATRVDPGPGPAAGAATPDGRALTRQVLDGVVRLGTPSGRSGETVLPHEVVVHAHPDDLAALTACRADVERAVANEIASSGEREGWVTAGALRIRDVVTDPSIRPGRPLVQRVMTASAGARRTSRPTLPVEPDPPAPPVERYVLVPLDGGGADPVHVPAAGGRIGRDPHRCAIVVNGSTVSREHAELLRGPDGYTVSDLGSVNGVSVNGRPAGQAPLRLGDVLGLGRTVRLRLQHAPSDRDGAGVGTGGR